MRSLGDKKYFLQGLVCIKQREMLCIIVSLNPPILVRQAH